MKVLVAVVVGVLAVVVLVAGAGLVAFGTTTSGTVSEGPVVVGEGTAIPVAPLNPPADGSGGVVFELRERGEARLLGIRFRRAQHTAVIAVAVPPDCIVERDNGTQELRDDGDCSDLPVRGDLSGGGTLESGVDFVFVDVPVSEQCFASLELRAAWPASSGPCAEH